MRKALLFFGILDDTDLVWMLSAGRSVALEPEHSLIEEGKPIGEIFIIIDGLLAVRTSRTGSRDVAQLRSGEIVGEMSFVDARPPSASVICLERSTVLAIPRAALAARLDDTGFAARFYRALAMFLSDRLRSTTGLLGYGSASSVNEDDVDELEPTTLDGLSIAAARFDFLQRKLKGD